MDNGHAGGTCMIEDICRPRQEGVFVVFGVNGNDGGLAIHAQDRGMRGIDGKCWGHNHLLPHERFCQVSHFNPARHSSVIGWD
jgi:hypothetical protein